MDPTRASSSTPGHQLDAGRIQGTAGMTQLSQAGGALDDQTLCWSTYLNASGQSSTTTVPAQQLAWQDWFLRGYAPAPLVVPDRTEDSTLKPVLSKTWQYLLPTEGTADSLDVDSYSCYQGRTSDYWQDTSSLPLADAHCAQGTLHGLKQQVCASTAAALDQQSLPAYAQLCGASGAALQYLPQVQPFTTATCRLPTAPLLTSSRAPQGYCSREAYALLPLAKPVQHSLSFVPNPDTPSHWSSGSVTDYMPTEQFLQPAPSSPTSTMYPYEGQLPYSLQPAVPMFYAAPTPEGLALGQYLLPEAPPLPSGNPVDFDQLLSAESMVTAVIPGIPSLAPTYGRRTAGRAKGSRLGVGLQCGTALPAVGSATGLQYSCQYVQSSASEDSSGSQQDAVQLDGGDGGQRGSGGGAKRSRTDDVRLINKALLEDGGFFDLPIQDAAAKLQVGVTTLKKVCRQLGVNRWPFRKRKSVEKLITSTQQYVGMHGGDADRQQQAGRALQTLVDQRKLLQSDQDQDLADSVKQYRQQFFKARYKEKKKKKGSRGSRTFPAAALRRIASKAC